MDDALTFADHTQYFHVADPAGITGLSAALWMKGCGRQAHGVAAIVLRGAVEHVDVSAQGAVGQVKAISHG